MFTLSPVVLFTVVVSVATAEFTVFFVVAAVVPVGFEVTDTVCELFIVVVAASLVSFSSFADEVLTASAAVTAVTGLDSASSVCPQAVSSRLHKATTAIAFFIKSPRLICFLNYSIKSYSNPDVFANSTYSITLTPWLCATLTFQVRVQARRTFLHRECFPPRFPSAESAAA